MYSQRRIKQCQVEMSLIDSQDHMKTSHGETQEKQVGTVRHKKTFKYCSG